jgi:hypothetical protein
MNICLSNEYIITQLDKIFESGAKSVIITLILYITHIVDIIQPWFFGSEFVTILTVLLMADMLIGIIKHKRLNDFSLKKMFHRMVFKLFTVAVATVSAKAIIDVTNTLSPEILIISVKLTIALYLFGNIDRNLCQITDGKLCFSWLIKKIKNLIPYLKDEEEKGKH